MLYKASLVQREVPSESEAEGLFQCGRMVSAPTNLPRACCKSVGDDAHIVPPRANTVRPYIPRTENVGEGLCALPSYFSFSLLTIPPLSAIILYDN